MNGLQRFGNGMVETGYQQDRREARESDEYGYGEFLLEFAAELSRKEWERIKERKGDE